MAPPALAQDAAATEVYGDWELSCQGEPKICSLSQANVEESSGNVRMRTEIMRLASGQYLLQLSLPQTVLLTDGPWLTVDGVYIGPLSYISCAAGCIARTTYSTGEIQSLINGTRAVVTVLTVGGQRLGVAMSLSGMKDAIPALDAAATAVQP